MKVLSLFDGIACGYEALKRAGIPIDVYYASEIDKHAIKVALKNHPDIIQVGDVTKLTYHDGSLFGSDGPDDVRSIDGPFDLVIGGSPCQGFSMAGKMLNFNDPRSKLFFEFVRLVKECKPKFFLLENVKMKKEYIKVINEQLWGVSPTEINSALLSAQNRKRLYRVGKLQEDGTYAKVEIPQPEDKGILLKDILLDYVEPKYDVSEKHTIAMKNARSCGELNLPDKDGKCGTIIASYYKTPQDGPYILKDYELDDRQVNMIANWKGYEKPLERVKGPEDKMDTLTTHCGKMSNGIKLVSIPCATQLGNSKNFGNAYGNEKAYTLRACNPNGVIESTTPPKIRKLHPIECERLQTLNTTKHKYKILFDFNDYEWFLEQTKNYVSVEEKCHKSQNVVGNVEKEDGKEIASFVEKSLSINNPQTNKLVQENVLINGGEGMQVKLFLDEQSMYVSDAEKNLKLVHQNKKDDFALGNVDIDMLFEKIVHLGNEGLLEKEGIYITQKSGIIQLKASGKEIMQLVKGAEKDLTTLKRHFTSIILNHSNIENLEQKLATLFYYVLIVIVGCIQRKTQINNSLEIDIETGYTAGISDTQRYKALGNGWTVDVIAHIFKYLK